MDDLRAKLIAKLAVYRDDPVIVLDDTPFVLPPIQPGAIMPLLPVQPQLDETRCIVCGADATHGITCRNKETGGWDHWNVCLEHKNLNKDGQTTES